MDFASPLTRQLEIIPSGVLGEPLTIIGGGAIGGWVALCAAKMGLRNITLYDPDTVELENMNSQFFRHRDIGRPKAEALRDLILDFTECPINAVNARYTGDRTFPGIVVSAVDNMLTRKVIWDAHKGVAARTRAIIDPRMGAETALLYTVRPLIQRDAEWYAKTLYTDENAVQERCTAKSTIYCANLLAGMVVKTVKNLIVDGVYPRSLSWDVSKDAFECFRSE